MQRFRKKKEKLKIFISFTENSFLTVSKVVDCTPCILQAIIDEEVL